MPHIPDTAHDTHDLELVAAYAAGDAEGPDLERATALVAACTGCAALHHDLRSIAAALPELPAPARPRDFRLTPEQAASLRPTGIRGLLAAFSGPRFAFATPLGTGLAALGIVGVLVASGGFASGGTGGAAGGAEAGTGTITMQAPAERVQASDAAAASGIADEPVAGVPASAAPSAGVDTMGGGEPSSPAPATASAAPVEPEASKAPGAANGSGPTPSANDEDLANIGPSPGASGSTDLPAAAIEPGPSIVEATPPATAIADDAGPIQPAGVVAAALLVSGILLLLLRQVARRTA